MVTPGEERPVCVTVTVRIPVLPQSIDADTATGQLAVERDRYVDFGRPSTTVPTRAGGGGLFPTAKRQLRAIVSARRSP